MTLSQITNPTPLFSDIVADRTEQKKPTLVCEDLVYAPLLEDNRLNLFPMDCEFDYPTTSPEDMVVVKNIVKEDSPLVEEDSFNDCIDDYWPRMTPISETREPEDWEEIERLAQDIPCIVHRQHRAEVKRNVKLWRKVEYQHACSRFSKYLNTAKELDDYHFERTRGLKRSYFTFPRRRYTPPTAEPQGLVEDWMFPTLKEAANGVTEVTASVTQLTDKIRSWCDAVPQSTPKALNYILFVLNQILMVKDHISPMIVFQLVISVFMYSGISLKDAIAKIQSFLTEYLSSSPTPMSQIHLTTLGSLYRGHPVQPPQPTPRTGTAAWKRGGVVAEAQMGLEILKPVIDGMADNASLVCGGIIMIITSVCSLPFCPTNIVAVMGKMKKVGDSATCVSSWIKSMITTIQDLYYKNIYGCSKAEYQLTELIPKFQSLTHDTYTLMAIPAEKFSSSKKLCEIVKAMYTEFQEMSGTIARKGGLLSNEVKYAFYAVERKFLPLYELAKASPLFSNISRATPMSAFFYGRPGVGKSNLVNMLAATCARRLYPNRQFSGENSVMWSRRVENEFHDGYAHQPFVQFDDCLQAVDSKVKPNPEFREIIYMINDAPYQLHMSDIKEKKGTFFDSEHVIASSNRKIPTAVSIEDVGAFTRRFNFAVEVKVSPQYGKLHQPPQGPPYYMVDETKVKSALDMDIYELHYYNLSDGSPVLENGQPKVHTFAQFVDDYCVYYDQRKQKRVNQRKAIYDQLNITITEDVDVTLKGSYATPQIGVEDLEPDLAEGTLPADILAMLDNAEPLALFCTNMVQGKTREAGLATMDKPSSRFAEVVDEMSVTEYGDPKDLDDENDDTHFDDRVRESSFTKSVEEKFSRIVASSSNLFMKCWKKMTTSYNTVATVINSSAKWVFAAACAIGALLASIYFLRPRTCMLSGKPEGSTNIFTKICRDACVTCDYLKATIGGSIRFKTGMDSRIQLGTWNLRASEILARNNREWLACSAYWARFLQDVSTTRDFEEDGIVYEHAHVQAARGARMRGRRAGGQVAQAESYGRPTSKVAQFEAYGRTTAAAARCEGYGRTARDVAEVQAGSNFDFNSISAASEQYVRILFRNTFTIILNGARTSGLFLTGRTILCNYHVWAKVVRTGSFELQNPGQDETTRVHAKECRWERVNRGGSYEQDLVVVELPRHIPMRPDILSKVISAPNQAIVEDAGATLVGFNRVAGLETLTERPLDALEIIDVQVQDEDFSHTIRRGYGYTAMTRRGDCGSLLFTHSTKCDGKLIGFHSAGNPKIGAGYSEALERASLQAAIKKLAVKTCLPVVGETQGMTRLHEWYDLGDVIHHGDSEFVPHQATRHEHKQSILSGVLAEPKAKLAHLKPVVVDGKRVDPLKKGLAKVANTPQRLSEKLLKLAVTDVKRTLKGTLYRPMNGVVSYETAIEGISGDQYIGPVKRSTSPGEPWKSLKKTTLPGKKEWLNVIKDGKVTDEYRVDEPTLKRAVMERIENARQGKRTPALYTASLKDERRPKEKVDAVKTRVFAAAPQDFVLAVRMYFVDFVATMMDCRINDEVAVGIDHRTEWPTLVNYLQGYGNNNVAGDFSNFDGSLLSEVMWEICDIINAWYADGEENALIREILFEDIASAYVNCRGHVVQWTHSQPSGNPLTVIVNSMFQMIMFRYVYLQLKAEEGLPLSCDFRRNVRMVTYGDDGVLSVRAGITSWFNQTTITKAFASVGLTYTDEAKTGALHTTRPLSELSFLKRSFVQTEGIWMGALDKDVIYEMCLWTRPSFEKLQTEENCSEALKEATAHGVEFYEEFKAELETANEATGCTLNFLDYTYDEMMEELYGDYF